MPDFDPHRGPQATREPNRLNRLLSVLMANLRTAWVGLGVLFFVMVLIPGALLIDQSSDKGDQHQGDQHQGDQHQADQQQAKQLCEGIHPGAIRKGKIAFDLAGEAAPVVQDPEGMGIAEQDVWTMNPNGSNSVNLTANSRDWDEAPAWSPDGRRIAFQKIDPVDDLAGRICVADADGSDRIEISPPKGGDVGGPFWSPDGQKIAFTSTEPSCRIYVANADGSGTPKELSTPGFLGCVVGRAWSPDGTQIAFDGYLHDSSWTDIYVMNVSAEGYTSGLRRLTDWRYTDEDAAWSPDGTEIAFSSNRAYLHNSPDPDLDRWQSEIYKIDVGSLKVTRLTHSPLEDTEPTWSPDGEQIAYVKRKLFRGTHSSIYKMDSDGSNSTPVFGEDRAYAFNPDWGP